MRYRAALVLAVALAGAAPAAENPAAALEAPAVNVIGTTPLPGVGTPVDEIPSNVQLVPERALRDRTVANPLTRSGSARTTCGARCQSRSIAACLSAAST